MPRQNLARTGDGIEDRYADTMRLRAARTASNNLLAAQLRAGQHRLALPPAQAVGATLGMRAAEVRAAADDITPITTGETA
jgi:hypothetical protein